MKNSDSIITIGLCPCWDITCRAHGLNWGEHKKIDSQTIFPAGKALNISKALAWLGTSNTAAGLWGQSDYQQMLDVIGSLGASIDIKFTAVPGSTRQNITVVDTEDSKEMHLRAPSNLANIETLNQLMKDLGSIVDESSVCVFAGQMSEAELLDDVASLISVCKDAGAKIVVDTSGESLKRIIDTGSIWLIKPNVQELCELLQEEVEGQTSAIIQAAKNLCQTVEIVAVSTGNKGAVVVTQDLALEGRFMGPRQEVSSTVACGDYFLAGFLDGYRKTNDLTSALERAIKVGTAHAWGWTSDKNWTDLKDEMKIEVTEIK